MSLLIEIIGWLGAVILLSVYYANIQGKLLSSSPTYIWGNIIGGVCFIINSSYHHAFPSAIVNIIWILIAVAALLKNKN